MQNSGVSLMTAVVTAVIVFLLGVAWASVKGSNKAYKTIKAGVKPARKIFWSNVGGVIKIGFWAVLLLTVLVVWQMHDVKTVDDSKPAPTPTSSHSPSPSASRR
jgi:ABC-type Fe3+ transport system permease subunit